MDWTNIIRSTVGSALGVDGMVYALAAIGLNIHFGYTGLLNFGQVGFMAAGAYGLGMTVFWWGQSYWLGLLFGVLFSVVLALLLGLPTLRLRADYLAIVTIASSETIRLFVRWRGNRNRTGAAEGINDFNGAFMDLNPFEPGKRYVWGPFNFGGQDLWVMLVGWTVVLLCVLLTWQLMRSPWGRVLKAIREDEDAARALGKSAYAYKVQALIVGGVIAGVAGMLQVTAKGSIQPDTFNPVITFVIWTALILGGAGRIWGPVVGAMIYWGLITGVDVVLDELRGTGASDELEKYLGLDGISAGGVRFMLLGLALVLLMRYRPQGIFGSREEMALDDR